MKLRRFLPLLLLPLLAACVHDGASYMVEDRNYSLSLIRDQRWFWDNKIDLLLVVTRLPACQRRHPIQAGTAASRVELFDMGGGTYALRIGKQMYVTEMRTCEGFAPLDAEPEGGLGTPLGAFLEKNGTFTFVKAGD
jgi:hypothetical protein